MVGIIVSLCLASKKPSEREFFVPAGTDLAVKLLITFFTFCLLTMFDSKPTIVVFCIQTKLVASIS